jgi:tripartite ATP-independent transporter DctM subunit
MTDNLAFLMFPFLLILILAGFPVAFSMLTAAILFGLFQFGDGAVFMLISKIRDVATNSVLAAVPLFLFMGIMLERAGIAERLFDAVHMWTRRLPGGLGVGTILMGAIFAAASGVVGATETVIGLLALPIMLKHAYDKGLIAGTVCASGSLGTVIPPSITVIVLGPVAGVAVGDLFAGLLFPGLIMAALFVIYVIGVATFRKELAPLVVDDGPGENIATRLRITVVSLAPPALLIGVVLGSVMAGMATPNEAAAAGALGTTIMSIVYRRFSFAIFWHALRRTASVTAMILMIVLAGNMFAGVFFATGGMEAVNTLLSDAGLTGWEVIAVLLFLTFLAGFMLDLISVILIIVPVAMPIVAAQGLDPIWFSIMFLVVLQTSYLTPPMAPSIFYLRAIAPPEITLKHMYRGVLPFIGVQIATFALIVLFPDIATWLPQQLGGSRW